MRATVHRWVHHALCVAVAWLALPGSADAADRLFELPVAGSYELPVIERVDRYELLDETGERVAVPDLAPGQCAVVSFVYLSCPDAGGCPLVLATLRRIDRAIADRPDFDGRVKLVTVSFDPERDGPEQLQMVRRHLDPKGDWRFLTGASDAEIRPVLDDYGQDALRLVAAETGESVGIIRHIAKVFLLDAEGGVRNIYSTGFLDPEILLRDIETLLGAQP